MPSDNTEHCQKLNIPRISHIMFLQVSFKFLDDGIESLHVPMSPAFNNIGISLLSFSTEPFWICIPVL